MTTEVALLGIGQSLASLRAHGCVTDSDFSSLGTCLLSNPLDKFTFNDLTTKFAPSEDDVMPISATIQDGSRINVSRDKLVPLLVAEISRLADEGIRIVLLDCTGSFEELYTIARDITVILPGLCLLNAVRYWLRREPANPLGEKAITVLVPVDEQIHAIRSRWTERHFKGNEVEIHVISPIAELQRFVDIGRLIRSRGSSLIIMDCMGYSFIQARMIEMQLAGTCELFLAKEVAINTIQHLLAS